MRCAVLGMFLDKHDVGGWGVMLGNKVLGLSLSVIREICVGIVW